MPHPMLSPSSQPCAPKPSVRSLSFFSSIFPALKLLHGSLLLKKKEKNKKAQKNPPKTKTILTAHDEKFQISLIMFGDNSVGRDGKGRFMS